MRPRPPPFQDPRPWRLGFSPYLTLHDPREFVSGSEIYASGPVCRRNGWGISSPCSRNWRPSKPTKGPDIYLCYYYRDLPDDTPNSPSLDAPRTVSRTRVSHGSITTDSHECPEVHRGSVGDHNPLVLPTPTNSTRKRFVFRSELLGRPSRGLRRLETFYLYRGYPGVLLGTEDPFSWVKVRFR